MKKLIKQNKEITFLSDIVLTKQQYHRIFFQVSLSQINDIRSKLEFIEKHFDKLQDWWHVDQLSQFIDKYLTFDLAFEKAIKYTQNDMTFARRWGYVLFMPSLVKEKNATKLFSLLKDDNEYYVQMAEAWLISYLAIYHPQETFKYLDNCNLNYNIVGKAIQKICDSFRISDEYKNKIKELRKKYK